MLPLVPALVDLRQAVVAVEVFGLGQGQLLEDQFGALEVFGPQRIEAIIPPVDVLFFREGADIGKLLPHATETRFQGGGRTGVVKAWHGEIVPQIGQGAREPGRR